MTTIVTRAGKGSALTHTEMDANITNLNNDKVETSILANYSTTVETDASIAAALAVHINDDTDAHVSSAIGYLPAGTGATVTDVQTKLREFVSVKDFGAVGNGIADDTAAISNALAVGGHVRFTPDKTYKFSKLVIPAGLTIIASGATFRSDGSLTTAGDLTIDIGANCVIDQLNISTPGTETNTNILRIGNGTSIGELNIVSDAQRADGGVIAEGQDVRIGVMRTTKIDRPLHLNNQSATTQTTGAYIGLLECTSYVRGFRADFCSFTVGAIKLQTRSANAAKSPGHNGVLICGCADWQMGDLYIADSGEHAFRIGGSPGTYAKTKNFQVGNIVAVRCGGCALKINPSVLVSAGVTEKVENFSFGNIVGIDVGDGSTAGNEELLRLTHAHNGRIESALAFTENETVSAQFALQANDISNLHIGTLGGESISGGFVVIDGTSDVDGVSYFGGDINGLTIDKVVGYSGGTNAIYVFTTFNVGNVSIGLDGCSGFTTNLLRWDAGTLADTFELRGRVEGSVAPVLVTPPASDNMLIDIAWNNTRSVGRGNGSRPGVAFLEYLLPAFSAANQPGNGIVVNSSQAAAGSGNYGGAIEFTRLASVRRGAAIVGKQQTVDDKEFGLDFFVGDVTTTANESLLLALSLKHTRRVALPALTTYADNAAALSGGLAVGDVYWTAAGDLRIVV